MRSSSTTLPVARRWDAGEPLTAGDPACGLGAQGRVSGGPNLNFARSSSGARDAAADFCLPGTATDQLGPWVGGHLRDRRQRPYFSRSSSILEAA